MNEVLLNKKASMDRCILQIKRYYAMNTGLPFESDFLRQDAICMNLQRICELAIDMANHVIRSRKLGLPKDSRDSFTLLRQADLIDEEQMNLLQRMVGFRNVLVHDYQRLDYQIFLDVIDRRLQSLITFANAMLSATA